MPRIRTLVAVGLIAAGASMATAPAWATPGNADNVTLCHRTDANNNPYVQITVDPDAVFKQGHDGHDGPVWNPSLKSSHTKWGDIIPPFDYTAKHGHTTTSAHYDGKNWTSDGRAIYDNGCTVPTREQPSPSPTTAPPTTASPTQTATQSPTQTPTPSPTQPTTRPTHSEIPLPPATATATTTVLPTHSERPTPTHSATPTQSPTPPIVCAGCPNPLPHTGFPAWPVAAVGGALVLTGAGLLRKRS